jgi:hypothetical protein
MATVKVTALTETTSPQATDVLLISQSGVSKKVQITNLPAGTPGTGSISTAMLADDAVTAAKLANSINAEITANTAKTSNATHSGEVTGATALTIADNIVDEANLKVSNTPTNGYVLTAQSGNTGGLTWAADANTVYTHPNHSGDVTSTADGATVIGNDKVITAKILDDNVTAAKLANSINTDIATGVTANTTANAALPKAGGTMTGNTIHNDNVKALFGTGSDLEIFHDGDNSYIHDNGTGILLIRGGTTLRITSGANEYHINCTDDAGVELFHNNVKKFETTANGVTVTGGAVGTMTTDNDGSFAMSASNNFKCTPAGNFALTFTAIVAQSGNILFINSGGHTISAHANTKVDANLLATISTAGTYLLAYFSDGTNVYMTNSAAYA